MSAERSGWDTYPIVKTAVPLATDVFSADPKFGSRHS